MNKKQQKQYDFYKSKLGITTKGEDFVLLHILRRDWNRDILLNDISEIKLQHGLIGIKCSTRRHSYNFSVSDVESNGFKEGMTQFDKELYIGGDLHHKLYE